MAEIRPSNKLSLSRLNLPPDLAQSIASMVKENEVASAATLVGSMSTTPLSKPPVAYANSSVIPPADYSRLQPVGDKTSRAKYMDDAELILLKSADGKLRVLYSRGTDEFFTVATEAKTDENLDDENEEQRSLLQSASRLAHSVLEDDLMNTDTETVQSSPEATRNSHDSASTVRSPPKAARNDSASVARPEGSRSQVHHPTVTVEPSEDEVASQQSLPTEGGGAEILNGGGADVPNEEDGALLSDEEMPDEPPQGSGKGSPDVVSQREGEKSHYVTFEDIKDLASHIRDGQLDAANQIIAALRSSNNNFLGGDPDDEGTGPRPSYPRRSRAPKKDKGVKFRSPFENALSREIRTHLVDELIPSDKWLKNTVTPQDIDDFDPKIGECCTADNFRLHLAGTPADTWNKSATRVFVNSFLEAHKQYEAQNTDIRDMVMKKCGAAVISTIRQYRSERKHRTENSRRLELDNKSRAERKRSLFHRRRDLTFFFPGLRGQREKLDLLGVAGMSSDEEEKVGRRKQWRILVPRWRSTRVTGWLRYFDALYDLARSDAGPEGYRGPLARYRASARRTSDSKKFVRGLPRNAYRTDWLQTLVDIDNMARPTAAVPWKHDPVIVELALKSWGGGIDNVELEEGT